MVKARSRKSRRKRGGKQVFQTAPEAAPVQKAKPSRNIFDRIYDTHYKKLLIIPVVIFLVAVSLIGWKLAATGDFMNRGVSLKGGITLTVTRTGDFDLVTLGNKLSSVLPGADISVRGLKSGTESIGFIIDADFTDEQSVDLLIATVREELGDLNEDDYTIETIGSSLGQSFFRETFTALIIAFILMSILVFLFFRVAVPSLAVILAAVSDIIVTLAIVNLIGMKISTAGIAAFLMLIGYSIDTDILLSTRVLKRKEGTVYDRVKGALLTGGTMTITTLVAVTVALIFAESDVLSQIMAILLIGLLVDLVYTWLMNAGLLRLYMHRVKHD